MFCSMLQCGNRAVARPAISQSSVHRSVSELRRDKQSISATSHAVLWCGKRLIRLLLPNAKYLVQTNLFEALHMVPFFHRGGFT